MTGVVCTFLGLTFSEGSRKPSPVLFSDFEPSLVLCVTTPAPTLAWTITNQ